VTLQRKSSVLNWEKVEREEEADEIWGGATS
jgi:hypothetical protein